ncbi:DUF7146 domain-containing protein [Sphingopyxis sp. R3-92]|uniref:DUF7146 domain-containing protein n=1 Tax=Sphingopyxis sp. R3-92 TaxID=3158553 RepID=UPI003EE5D7BE
MESPASDIARRLGENAEAVCRRYLSNGRREGHYWLVGDVRNTPGRSLYVRLEGGDLARASGKWTDAASGDHGDLLDVIAAACGHASFRDTLAEARLFLSLPAADDLPAAGHRPRRKAATGSIAAAERLWTAASPIPSTRAATYLAERGIMGGHEWGALRYHPRCYYRPSADDAPDCRKAWPAMIAAVTDDNGKLTGVHRTWLDVAAPSKAPIAYPRRAMGSLLGHGVRFGSAAPVMVAGEGIETLLSVRELLPSMSAIAGLSSAHLAAIGFPPSLSRLYVARDRDPAGAHAFDALAERAAVAGIELLSLEPHHEDFNHDLQSLGRERIGASLRTQLSRGDRDLLRS